MNHGTIWSLHDVSPGSIDAAGALLRRLSAAKLHPVCVLIIPSGDWSVSQLEVLREWEARGYTLAAHGWSHRSTAPRTLHHRLHSMFFSRDVAEHLGKTERQVRDIVERGAGWFTEAGLEPPTLYVPPAWAIGALPLRAFAETGYRWVETLTGIYSVRGSRFHRLPLVGFEADSPARATALTGLNRINRLLATATGRPLRVAVHPRDFDLLLARDLERLIDGPHEAFSLATLDRP
jgi:uncharacterized protein